MANQARDQIRGAGFKVDENSGGREYYKQLSIRTIPFDKMSVGIRAGVTNWLSGGGLSKKPNVFKTYGMMVGQLAISFVMPWVGISMMLFSMFGKKKKKMAVPWGEIYSQALPFAQQTTVDEEVIRLVEEKQQIEQIRAVAIEKKSIEAAQFKLPEGVVGIRRGALVMTLKGPSVETKVG